MSRWVYIGIALIVGFISVLPYFLAYEAVAPYDGKKLPYFYQDSELVYLSRIRDIVEGNIMSSSPVFAEYKDTKAMQLPYGEWVYALVTFGNPNLVPLVGMVSKFVFPTLLFIFVFLLLRVLLTSIRGGSSVDNWVALSISVFILLAYDFNNIPFWRELFVNESGTTTLSLWTRLVNPITGSLGLFITSYLALTIQHKHPALRTIGAGLVLGIMSGYIFSFALGLTTFFILMLFALYQKDPKRTQLLALALVIAVLVNIHYFIAIFFSHTDSTILTKLGLLLSHEPLPNKVLTLALGVFALSSIAIYLRHSARLPFWRTTWWQWSFTVLLAGFICLNQQIITGKTVWPGHFVQYTNPLAYIIFFTSLYAVMKLVVFDWIRKTRVQFCEKLIISFSVIAMVFVIAINILNISLISNDNPTSRHYASSQRYAPFLAWLNERAEPSCVVFVLEREDRLEKNITAYTPCDLYHSSYVFFGVPAERILHNYVVQLRLLGIRADALSTYLDENEREIRRYFFEDWVDMFYHEPDHWVFYSKPEADRERFMPLYKERITKAYNQALERPLEDLLTDYRISYIAVDIADASVALPQTDYEIVYNQYGVMVYKVD